MLSPEDSKCWTVLSAESRPPHSEPKQSEFGTDDAPLAVIGAGGYRSSAAASILARNGFRAELRNVIGGTAAWIRERFALETGHRLQNCVVVF